MKFIRFLILTLMAFNLTFQGHAQDLRLSGQMSKTNFPDTIMVTDTIFVKEVIERNDVIYRTEKIIRYKDKEEVPGKVIQENSYGIIIPSASDMNKAEIVISDSIQGPGSYYKLPDGIMVSTTYNGLPLVPDCPPDGNFIWVPDSLDKSVMDLLHGKKRQSVSSAANDLADPNEKVLFRGDTIPMILKDRNLGRYDRGLFNYLFIPKGIWQIGLTASYGEFSTEDLQILDLVSDIDFYGHIFSIKPYFSYFINNNVSLGLKLGYTSGKARIGSFKMDIDEDMSFDLHDILYKSDNYSAAITLTQYLGITRRGRFGVFNEVELAFAGGSSDFNRPYNGEMRRTHTNIFEAGLNFSPGLCVYMLDQLSFNVSFGVFGLNIRHEKQKVNDEPLGKRTTSGANFRFNIFNINFGIAINI